MPSPDPSKPADMHDSKDARLPVPAQDRRRVARTSRAASVNGPDTLVRALVDAPFVAGSVAGAAAAAVMTGAAMATRLLWPWASRPEPPWPSQQPQSLSTWVGPGVRVSYTHIEMRWPLQR
jgi:hypothetical protein